MEPKKNECSAEAAPSQAVGQPDFYGIPPGEVLYQSGDSFKRFMEDHTEILIQKMISEKIIGKKFGKAIKSQHNSLDMLLATMKKMSPKKFVKYLQLLLTISKPEERVTKKGAEKVVENSKEIQDGAKNLMRIMKGSLEAMKPAPGSDLHTVIAEFVHFVSQDDSDQSQTTVSQDTDVQSQTTVSQDDSVQTISQDGSDRSQTTVSQDGSDQSQATVSQDGSDQSQTTVSQDGSINQSQTSVSQDGSDQSQTTVFQDGSDQSQTTVSQDDSVQTISQDGSDRSQTTVSQDGSDQSQATVSQDGSDRSQTTVSQDDSVQTISQDGSDRSQTTVSQDGSDQSQATVSQDGSDQSQITVSQDGSINQSQTSVSQDGSDQSQTTVFQDGSDQSQTTVSQDDSVQTISQDGSDRSQTTVSQDDSVQTISQDGSDQSQTTVSQDGSDQSQATVSQDGSDRSQTTVSQDDSVQTISQDGSDRSQTTVSQDGSDQSQATVSQDGSDQSQTTVSQDGSINQSQTSVSQDGSDQSQTTVFQDGSDQSQTTVSQDDSVQTISQDGSDRSQTTVSQDDSVQTISQHGSDRSQTTVSQDGSDQSQATVSQDGSDQSQITVSQDGSINQSQTSVSQDGSDQSQTTVFQDGSDQSQTTVSQDDSVQTISQDGSDRSQTTVSQDDSVQTISQDGSDRSQTTVSQDGSDQSQATVSQDGSDRSQTTVSQDDSVQTISQDGSDRSQTTVSQDGSDQSQATVSQDGSDRSQTTVSQDDCVQTISQDGSINQSQNTVSQDICVQSQTTVSQDGSDQSQTTVSQDQSQDIVSQDDTQTTVQLLYVDLPPKPPEGHLENAVSRLFTNEGGTLYSALHGVTVIIPPNAIPEAFSPFSLSMHFYLQQPFTLLDDADPCSVIVWLHQDSHFHFLEDVTVKIPHAAVVDDSLCVLTWGEDKQWNLNTEVPADFSDGYHAVIKVKHFCGKVVAKLRRNPERKCKKQTGSSKNLKRLKSGSFGTSIDEGVASLTNSTEVDPNTKPLPHQDVLKKKMKKKTKKKTNKLKRGSLDTSIDEGLASLTNSTEADPNTKPFPRQDAMECDSSAVPISSQDSLTTEENESGFKYSVACSMPSDRSMGYWKVQFAACQSNPTGISLLRKSAEKVFGRNAYFYQVEDIRIKGGYFEMCPETWSDNIWKIDASEKEASISEEQILSVSECADISEQSFPNLPRLCYDVYHLSKNVHSKLHCCIYAQRARTANGCTPRFIITSTPVEKIPITKNGKKVVTIPYLYGIDSDIIRVLTHQGQNIILDTLTSEHLKFLADISLQLSDTQQLCKALNIEYRPNEKEDTFTVLGKWVVSQGGAASLIRLKEQLSAIDIVDIAVCEDEDSNVLLSPHLEDCFILDVFIKGYTASSYTALLNLSTKLQNCWRIVGCLLGILPEELDKIDLPEEKLYNIIDPPLYQLIFNWQRREGRGATFGALFKAIHRVYHHKPFLVNDAHLFSIRYVNKHLPIPVHVVH